MKVPTGRWFQRSVGSKGEGPRTSQKLFTSLSRTPLCIPAIGWLVGKTLTTCRGLAYSGDASGDGPNREIPSPNDTPTAPPQFRLRSQRQHTWFAIARDTAEQTTDYTKAARRHGWFATWRDLLPIVRVTTPEARGTRTSKAQFHCHSRRTRDDETIPSTHGAGRHTSSGTSSEKFQSLEGGVHSPAGFRSTPGTLHRCCAR